MLLCWKCLLKTSYILRNTPIKANWSNVQVQCLYVVETYHIISLVLFHAFTLDNYPSLDKDPDCFWGQKLDCGKNCFQKTVLLPISLSILIGIIWKMTHFKTWMFQLNPKVFIHPYLNENGAHPCQITKYCYFRKCRLSSSDKFYDRKRNFWPLEP